MRDRRRNRSMSSQGRPNCGYTAGISLPRAYETSNWETRSRIVVDQPATTGSERYDALLAGIVELACASHLVVAPLWVNDESYFLGEWWFISGIASLHADALVHSPISLARRGVFVTQGALEYA